MGITVGHSIPQSIVDPSRHLSSDYRRLSQWGFFSWTVKCRDLQSFASDQDQL